MKIYCSKQYENELDKFVGKDIWVKAKIAYVANPCWIKLIEKITTPKGNSYKFKRSLIDITTRPILSIFDREVRTYSEDRIELVHPIEAIDDSEVARIAK